MALSYTQYKADIKAITFDQYDKDGNGTLDVKELKDIIEKMKDWIDGFGRPDPLLEMLTRADLDANGDGVISFDEFWASHMKLSGFEDDDAAAKDFESRPLSVEDWEVAKEGFKAKLQAS